MNNQAHSSQPPVVLGHPFAAAVRMAALAGVSHVWLVAKDAARFEEWARAHGWRKGNLDGPAHEADNRPRGSAVLFLPEMN